MEARAETKAHPARRNPARPRRGQAPAPRAAAGGRPSGRTPRRNRPSRSRKWSRGPAHGQDRRNRANAAPRRAQSPLRAIARQTAPIADIRDESQPISRQKATRDRKNRQPRGLILPLLRLRRFRAAPAPPHSRGTARRSCRRRSAPTSQSSRGRQGTAHSRRPAHG